MNWRDNSAAIGDVVLRSEVLSCGRAEGVRALCPTWVGCCLFKSLLAPLWSTALLHGATTVALHGLAGLKTFLHTIIEDI